MIFLAHALWRVIHNFSLFRFIILCMRLRVIDLTGIRVVRKKCCKPGLNGRFIKITSSNIAHAILGLLALYF